MALQVLGPPQGPGGRFLAGVEFVQVPAQPVDHPGPLGNEVVAVVTEQSHLAGGAVERARWAGRVHAARREPPPARRSGRTCRSCAPRRGRAPSAWAAPARSARRRRAGRAPSGATGGGSPRSPSAGAAPNCSAQRSKAEMIAAGGAGGPLTELAAGRHRRRRRCGCACARRFPTITMVVSPFLERVIRTGPVGTSSVGAMPRSYQATPAGPHVAGPH